MTEKALVANKTIGTVDTITEIYDSPTGGLGTVIRAMTVTNNLETSASYKAYIYDSAGSVVQAVCPLTQIARDRFDSAGSVVNQVIPPGGTLRAENSAENAVNFYVSGIEQ